MNELIYGLYANLSIKQTDKLNSTIWSLTINKISIENGKRNFPPCIEKLWLLS